MTIKFHLSLPYLFCFKYSLRFNFRGVYISRICNFCGFHVFKFADAGYSGVEIFAGEIFADIRSESVYHNSIRQVQRCKTRWTRWIRMKMSSFQIESCIRGFHIYKEVWTSFIGERLGCVRERNNREDPFAVAMKRGNETVGHVPCTLFLRQRGSISCEVTGSRRRSVDLPHGGLELPCILTLSGPEELVDKLIMRIDEIAQTKTGNSSAAVPTKGEETVPIEGEDTAVSIEGEDEALPIKVEVDSVCTMGEETEEVMANKKEEVWLSFKDIVLRLNDKHTIDCDQRLTDLHINFAQRLLKHQFPKKNGLRSTLLQERPHSQPMENAIQILHVRPRSHYGRNDGGGDGTATFYRSHYTLRNVNVTLT